MKTKPKLMWKIFGFLIGFCTLLLAILWLFQTVFLEKMYEDIRRNEIEEAMVLVEENIDSSNINQILRDLANYSDIVVTPEHNFSSPEPTPFRETIEETKEFTLASGQTVSMVFYAMISPINATISTIQRQLYYVTALMILLAIILAFIIARYVSKPIEVLNKEAKNLATGNYDVRFSGKGYREIHELTTTLNYTAKELSKVEKLRQELLANISHDLRTPLSLIYSYSEMMHDFPDEISAEQIEVIMDETTRLSLLVNDILNVSKLETGVEQLNQETFNLTTSIQTVIQRLSALVANEGYQLIFEPEEEIFLYGDQGKLLQVIYNLLINAIHYSGEDKEVILHQHSNGKYVRIEVEDHGVGIDPADIPYIWDRYYKVEQNHKRAVVGTGLGLSIVKKVVQMHNGQCGVISRKNQGTTFWIELEMRQEKLDEN